MTQQNLKIAKNIPNLLVLLACLCLPILTARTARAGGIPAEKGLLLLDHQPYNFGGPAADTELRLSPTGPVVSQLLADQFRLDMATPIGSIVWWGFYGSSFIEEEEPPPDFQTFRMRIYDARAGDGLPGEIVAERQFENPSFAPTGRPVFTSVFPPEFRFEATLNRPLLLAAENDYWFEITQLGSPDSRFRWMLSESILDDHVFLNASDPDWQFSNSDASLAYQLIAIPEPTTSSAALVSLGALLIFRRRKAGC